MIVDDLDFRHQHPPTRLRSTTFERAGGAGVVCAARLPLVAVTKAEYLAFDRSSDEKYEFVDGHLIPVHGVDPATGMAGATREHNLIVGNLVTALNVALRSSSCGVFLSDMRVPAERAPFYYPDASVACSPIVTVSEEGHHILQNPALIVEVLSKTTEDRGRGEKARAYRHLPSCIDYLICSSSEALVEHQSRANGRGWQLAEYGPGETISLAGLGITLAVDDLYLKVFR